MPNFESLTRLWWDCKCPIVFTPKRQRKERYVKILKFLGSIFHELAQQKDCQIVEGHMVHETVKPLALPGHYGFGG